MQDPTVVAHEFIDAFNRRQLDRFVATLHADVELHSGRGLRVGREQARRWATRSAEGVQQRIVVERMEGQDDRALALIAREWWWEDDAGHEFAHSDEMAWLFRLEDGLVRGWRPFEVREDAMRAFADPDRG